MVVAMVVATMKFEVEVVAARATSSTNTTMAGRGCCSEVGFLLRIW